MASHIRTQKELSRREGIEACMQVWMEYYGMQEEDRLTKFIRSKILPTNDK